MTNSIIANLEQLEAIYGKPSGASVIKVADHVTQEYGKWIEASRFCILTTVGPEGTDGSPRGDDGPVVKITDPKTLLMPDWRGNNRTDSLRNIVRDGRVSLMFMVQGTNNVTRVNGTAVVSVDPELIAGFNDRGRVPGSVIVITVNEVYSQCARALMRAGTWNGENHSEGLPSLGDILSSMQNDFDGKSYDENWAERAKATMWNA